MNWKSKMKWVGVGVGATVALAVGAWSYFSRSGELIEVEDEEPSDSPVEPNSEELTDIETQIAEEASSINEEIDRLLEVTEAKTE